MFWQHQRHLCRSQWRRLWSAGPSGLRFVPSLFFASPTSNNSLSTLLSVIYSLWMSSLKRFGMMGSCLSRRSAHSPTPTATATAKLVVLQEDAGVLIREFPEPVKVAEILRESPGFFVCHADSMRYNEYVYPLSAEQELQVEHLYFMLPVTTLNHPLPASDMAALAVKASAAMDRSRRYRQTHGFMFSSSSAGVGDESKHGRSEWKNEERIHGLQRINGRPGRKRHDEPLSCDPAMRTRTKLGTIEESFAY